MISFIYSFACYEDMTPHGIQKDYCSVEIRAETLKDAEGRVRSLVKKKHYDLFQVIERQDPSRERPPYVFVLQCHNRMLDDGNLLDNVLIELWDHTSENAVKRAKKVIKRKFYRVKTIIEKPNDEL